MTARVLSLRLAKLERAANAYRSYLRRPAEEWPDSALVAYLRACGAWTPPPGQAEPTDEELRAIAADWREH